MKRLWGILFAIVLTISLLGCAKQETVYTVSRNNIEFQIDSEQKTVSDGNHTYRYELSGDSASYRITITYPNGSSYWFNKSGSTGYGGWSDDYNETVYISGDVLVDVVQKNVPEHTNPGKFVAALLLIALGIFDMAAPKVSWYLGYGWRYKNAEPSDAALIFARIGGGVVMLAGIILMLC